MTRLAARAIAAGHPAAVQAAKRSFRLTEEMRPPDGYRYQQSQIVEVTGIEDAKEDCRRASAGKRAPLFQWR